MKRLFTFVFCLLSFTLFSQELNCSVQVLSPQLTNTTDKKIFETLKQSIYEFMNNRKWTNDVFQQDERIECSLVLTITDRPSSDQFSGNIQVQARRPIYKSSYNSLLINILDKNFSFKYVEYQPLEFIESTFSSNLTSILSFYAYVIVGSDYDSFSLEGGTPYFQKAQTIVSNAQSTSDMGWKSSEDKPNRYWIVENLLNSTYKPLRECMYKYHRNGFDAMSQDLPTSRANVLSSLQLLKQVYDNKPGNYSLTLFFLAKADEIVNLFTPAEPEEKSKVLALVNEIDPANSIKYNKINQKSGE